MEPPIFSKCIVLYPLTVYNDNTITKRQNELLKNPPDVYTEGSAI